MTEGPRILAVITTKENEFKVGGGAPIFYVKDDEEQEDISMILARLTMGMVHDLGNGVKIVIRH
ncbi:capping complex subunit for YIEGIA [Natronospora cellulosivora (SeqCode)]